MKGKQILKEVKSLYELVQREIDDLDAKRPDTEISNSTVGVTDTLNQDADSIYSTLNNLKKKISLLETDINRLYTLNKSPGIINGLEISMLNDNKISITKGSGLTNDREEYTLDYDTSITVDLPKEKGAYFIILNDDNKIRMTNSESDSAVTLGKIVIQNSDSTIITDNRENKIDGYLYSAREEDFDNDFRINDSTIPKLQNFMTELLAENLIGTINISENLSISNERGTMEADSENIIFYDNDGNELAKYGGQEARIGDIILEPDRIRSKNFSEDSSGFSINSNGRISALEGDIGNIIMDRDGLHSENYVSGSDGFKIDKDGNAEFNDIVIRGTIYADNGEIGGINIDETGLYSDNYVEGSSGFRIDYDGEAEFDSITLRNIFDDTNMRKEIPFTDAEYTGNTIENIFSVTDIHFKPDGTKIYAVIGANTNIVQWDLTIPWDISSATNRQTLGRNHDYYYGMFISPDGNKLFIYGALTIGGDIYLSEYPLSTSWDVTSAGSYLNRYNVSSASGVPAGLFFKPDGTKFYLYGGSSTIEEYEVVTPWSLSSVSYNNSFSKNHIRGLYFESDGKTMYTNYADSIQTQVHKYSLGTAWDISTLSDAEEIWDFPHTIENDGDLSLQGITFSDDESKMYISAHIYEKIYEFSLEKTMFKTDFDNNTITMNIDTLDLQGGHIINSADTYTTSFVDSDLSTGILNITHNVDSQYLVVNVYDNNDNIIMPDNVTATDNNNMAIDLSSYTPLSGTWNVRVRK